MSKKSYNKRYLPLSFSKYNQASPKLVYSQETSDTVMRTKFKQISMKMQRFWNQTDSA